MAQCRDRRPFDSAPSFFRARFPPFVAVTVADYKEPLTLALTKDAHANDFAPANDARTKLGRS